MSVVCCLLFVNVHCLLCVVFVDCGSLCVVPCSLLVGWCLLCVGGLFLDDVSDFAIDLCRLFFFGFLVGCWSLVVGCVLFVV